ncbi:MAG: hypothetical protein ACTS4U_00125 [Candidatus Hodgkinia cicadicola]
MCETTNAQICALRDLLAKGGEMSCRAQSERFGVCFAGKLRLEIVDWPKLVLEEVRTLAKRNGWIDGFGFNVL